MDEQIGILQKIRDWHEQAIENIDEILDTAEIPTDHPEAMSDMRDPELKRILRNYNV